MWGRDGLPRARDFNDIYFSATDPFSESRHVFVDGNALPERMAAAGSRSLIIGECGFGFGLNFLETCEHFIRLAPANARLHYISCELQPVRRKDLKRFFGMLPANLLTIAGLLLGQYPEQGKGLHRFQFIIRKRHITLDLVYGNAAQVFRELSLPDRGVDAWYLDGFAPHGNPAMWDSELFRLLAGLSHAGTTLATYSVSGTARRNLEAAGFLVTKAPGFGGKRHMLTGRRAAPEGQPPSRNLSWTCPWPAQLPATTTVAVIGGGLAGCATANALAAKGLSVTLFEKNAALADASSGNPRGIVHFSPALRLSPAARFRLQAFLHASRHYRALSTQEQFGWEPTGVIQLAVSDKELKHSQSLAGATLYDPALLRPVTANEVSALAGMEIGHGGFLQPQAGSLDPAALCRAWIARAGIACHLGTEATGFVHDGRCWQLSLSAAGTDRTEAFDALVICNNADAGRFGALPDYPVVANHGQTDTYVMTDKDSLPGTILCHKGYVIPWHQRGKAMATIGGSYAQGKHSGERSGSLDGKNLTLVRKFAPAFHETLRLHGEHVTSRAGTRITTPDYLPLAGPVENTAACTAGLSGYRRNARKQIRARGEYLPGLYVNLAHGSSGLVTTPLLAEYLASLLSGEPLPLLNEEIQAIHPLRFLVRALKRQKAG